MIGKLFGKKSRIVIESREDLEKAAIYYGMLPFFNNPIRGFSVAEMAAPGMLFGGDEGYDGCWEWKGPVIREKTTAYGKFFRRKAGFVSMKYFPDFLNYRRYKYPVAPESTEEMLLDIIRENDGLTSTELRKLINGVPAEADMFTDAFPLTREGATQQKVKRSSLEGPLQRLQMGGWLLITDFVYKQSKKGERYGWGVARYSTPELWFGKSQTVDRSPEESLQFLVKELAAKLPWGEKKSVRKLLT